MILASFIFFLLLFIGIGLLSARKSKGTNSDYLVASRSVKPWLVALSAVSTNNSGYMFIGQIGFTYLKGISSIWLMIGWVTGDFLMSLFVHKRLQDAAGERNILSFGGLVARWWGTNYKTVRLLVGIITVVFLGAYAAAQFKAGGKALHVLFGWNDSTGIIIGTVMVVAYCFAGGIRASIWTDVAQSIVMIIAMTLLFGYAVMKTGGVGSFWHEVHTVSPYYLNWFPKRFLDSSFMGPFLFALGWLFAGFGIVGQPHVMIRMMTMNNEGNEIIKFRSYYYTWYVAFYLLAIGVGLAARILIPNTAGFDPELALPMLSQELLPEVLVGVMLAGIFAATMSTADSQILSCSAAVTRDILPGEANNYWLSKATTLVIAIGAMLLALFGSQNVFSLVLISWSVLSAAFAPIMILYSLGKRIDEKTLIGMIVLSVTTTILWRDFGLTKYIYEVAPGIACSFAVYFISKLRPLKYS